MTNTTRKSSTSNQKPSPAKGRAKSSSRRRNTAKGANSSRTKSASQNDEQPAAIAKETVPSESTAKQTRPRKAAPKRAGTTKSTKTSKGGKSSSASKSAATKRSSTATKAKPKSGSTSQGGAKPAARSKPSSKANKASAKTSRTAAKSGTKAKTSAKSSRTTANTGAKAKTSANTSRTTAKTGPRAKTATKSTSVKKAESRAVLPVAETLIPRLDELVIGGKVQRDDTMQAAGIKIFGKHFKRLLQHEAGTIEGIDPEELHDMRVASRRLRAALRVFRPAFGQRLFGFKRDLPYVTRALGGVRDIDVFIPKLKRAVEELGTFDVALVEPMVAHLNAKRERNRTSMKRTLTSQRYRRLCERFTAFIEHGPAQTSRLEGASATVADCAPRMIRKRLKTVLRDGRAIGPELIPEMLHALRIRCKMLRYTMEFFKPAYGQQLDAYIRKTVELQDLLGDHQDADVAIEILQAFLQTPDARRASPQTAAAIGELIAHKRIQAEQMRQQFVGMWKAFDNKASRRLLFAELSPLVLPTPSADLP